MERAGRPKIDDVLPRTPARSMVAVGGTRPAVLLFPSPRDDQIFPVNSAKLKVHGGQVEKHAVVLAELA